MSKLTRIEHPKDRTKPTQITRIKQIDFLAQLEQALARYDHDNDGQLSDDAWEKVQQDYAARSKL